MVLYLPAPEPAKKLWVPELIQHPVLLSPILMLLLVYWITPPILTVLDNVLIPEILKEVPTTLVPLIEPPTNSPYWLLKILLAVKIPVKYPLPSTQSFSVGLSVPIPTLKLLLPVIQELVSEPMFNWSEPVVFGNWTL